MLTEVAYVTLLAASMCCVICGLFVYDNGHRWYGRLCWAAGVVGGMSGLGGIAFGGIGRFWGSFSGIGRFLGGLSGAP